MGNAFWVHYQRKADGQDFHERLTAKGLLELLTCGGVRLCGLEAECEAGNTESYKNHTMLGKI